MTEITAERLLWGLCWRAHQQAVASGFHDQPRDPAVDIALIHSELSEALEALRDGNPPSDKGLPISGVEEELADAVIRICDLCGRSGYDLGRAIEVKMEYNATRPKKHGRGF